MCVLVSICICFVCIRGFQQAKTKTKAKAKAEAVAKPKAKAVAKPKAKAKAKAKAHSPKDKKTKGLAFIKRPAAQSSSSKEEHDGEGSCLHTICFCLLVCLHFTFDRPKYNL
jgi:hypothetical protein